MFIVEIIERDWIAMNRILAILGVALSAIYLYLLWALIGERILDLKSMELNAVGDFFAGAFGPIAIFWLVLGFFQQGYELRQNNEALTLQALELKNSVDQQKDLVEVTRKQVQMEFDNLRVSRERRTNEIRPFFVVEGAGGAHSGDRHQLAFCIKNLGCKITRVEFKFSEKFASLDRKLHVLDSGGSAEFKIEFNGTGEGIASWAKVFYSDADYNSHATVFKFWVDPTSSSRAFPSISVELQGGG